MQKPAGRDPPFVRYALMVLARDGCDDDEEPDDVYKKPLLKSAPPANQAGCGVDGEPGVRRDQTSFFDRFLPRPTIPEFVPSDPKTGIFLYGVMIDYAGW